MARVTPMNFSRKGKRVVLPLLKGKGKPEPLCPNLERRPMTSYLIDINVWLAMTWDLHPQHLRASRWCQSRDRSTLMFCRFTMLGFCGC